MPTKFNLQPTRWRRPYKSVIFSVLSLCAVAPGYSQLVSFGVKAGVPLTDNLISGSDGNDITTSEPQHWLVGPTVELRLPFRLSFEVDALYRENKYQTQRAESAPGSSEWFTGVPVSVVHHYSLNNWQFPFLAKYELRGGTFRPFLDAGV